MFTSAAFSSVFPPICLLSSLMFTRVICDLFTVADDNSGDATLASALGGAAGGAAAVAGTAGSSKLPPKQPPS